MILNSIKIDKIYSLIRLKGTPTSVLS